MFFFVVVAAMFLFLARVAFFLEELDILFVLLFLVDVVGAFGAVPFAMLAGLFVLGAEATGASETERSDRDTLYKR